MYYSCSTTDHVYVLRKSYTLRNLPAILMLMEQFKYTLGEKAPEEINAIFTYQRVLL